ncbi:hypothetical protein [Chryseobacterium sp. OSA05B]|uniref:hypothetical protein n=1 Tax=Chryseobacterium sp. OSA05B TaxID=2862650 RepID=UPI001CBC402F|nr:hypothetical protein [Chryseobacterium sp. OSA05B]
MRKIYLLLTFIICNLYFPQTQNTVNFPTSPEVAMFKRFGDIPVSHYTGVSGTEILLYTLNQYGFSIPISLNYQASGIKLDDQATWVGLGWNLMPEGIIYQDVKGKADQSDGSYISPNDYAAFYNRLEAYPGGTGRYKIVKQKGFADYNWCMPSSGPVVCFPPFAPTGSDSDVIVNDLVYRNYGEVDTFRFNFYGHTGSFFINLQTKQVFILDKSEDIQFQVTDGKIIATDNKGIKYTFGQRELFTSHNGNSLSPDYSSRSYKISEIELPTKQKILFEYDDANYYFHTFTQSRNIYKSGYNMSMGMCDGKINYQYQNPQSIINVSSVKILRRIKTDDLLAQFNLEDRQDINVYDGNNLKRLKSIDVFNNRSNKKIKSIDFTYTYFPYIDDFPSVVFPVNSLTSTQKDALGKRLKLDKVSMHSYDNSNNKIDIGEDYNFDYNMTTTLPAKVSFAKDFWGFYNGHSSNVLLPDLKFYLQANSGLPMNYEGNNRYSNKDYVDAYMLRKIQYPTKGYTEFAYEVNSFKNQFIPSHDQLFDLTKTELLNNTGVGGYSAPHKDTLSIKITTAPKTFRFTNMFSGGFDGGPSGPQSKRYDYYQMISAGASIQFLKVKTNSNGTPNIQVLKQWNLANVVNASTFHQTYSYQWQELYTVDLVDPDPTTKYMVKLNLNNNMYHPADIYHSAGVFSTVSYVDSPTVDSDFTSFGHGPRIKSVKNYSNQGILADWKNYEYDEGVLQNRINPINQKDYYCFDCSSSTPCSGNVSYNEFYVVNDKISSSEYDAVGYGKVTEKMVDVNNSTQFKGKTEYHYYNLENTTSNSFPVIKKQTNGLLSAKVVKDKNDNLLRSETYRYSNLIPFNQFYSVRAEKKFLLGGNGKDPYLTTSGEYDGLSKYVYYVSPMISESYKLDSLITKQYFGDKIITTKKLVNYNTQGLVKKEDLFYENNNKLISTEFKYAQEKGNQLMLDNKMTGIPLETSTSQTIGSTTKTLSRTETIYPKTVAEITNNNASLVLPLSSVSYDLQNNAPSTEATYDRYDSKGNIQQYTTRNGISTTVIWGYKNSQPIVKIEGAKLSDISQSLIDNIVSASDNDAQLGTEASEQSLVAALDLFRNNSALSAYQISTYTYNPLIGVTSITPPSGIREVYIYDTANRLKEVKQLDKDASGNPVYKIIKEFKYNYKQ